MDKVHKATPPRKKDPEHEWDNAYAPLAEEYGNTLRDSIKLL
jgi:hypothetical protein